MFDEMLNKKCKMMFVIMTVVTICLLLLLGLTMTGIAVPASSTESGQDEVPESLSNDDYTLEKVVVLSRHNIRSPLIGGDSVLGQITPHEWFEWTSPASQLSVRGGTLETGMGQYFRKWLEDEGLFPENYQPDKEDVRIYANSKQRTIATARFFTSGLLPASNEEVEYHAEFDTMDPVFNPQLTFVSDEYARAAKEQIDEMYSDDIEDLKDNYELISDVIDMEESEAYKDGSVKAFRTDDTEITIEKDKEPAMEGSLKTGCSVSDAMTLQYYEEEDPAKAAFGKSLSREQWDEITEIKDLYSDVLFTAPLISCNVANPLLKEMLSEISNDGREFTFLCGHDSNLLSVLSALEADDYILPEALERKTPIGCKLVFSKWKAENGEEYWDADLVYQTTDQLRNADILTEKEHPASVDISFKGLKANEDGMYTDKDIKGRFRKAVGEYDHIVAEYSHAF